MTHHAKTGGILTIISGVFCIFFIMLGALYALMPRLLFGSIANSDPSLGGQQNLPPGFLLIFTSIGVGISVFFMLVGALAITGGIFALKRKTWALAIAGAIAGSILFFPLGITATILLSLGKSEFSAVAETNPLEELPQQETGTPIKPGKATTAGILTIISGVFGILWLGYAFFLNSMFRNFSSFTNTFSPMYFMNQFYQILGAIYIVLGIVMAILGVFAIIAGVKTLKRSNWKLGLAGAIASTVLFFPCGTPAIMLMYNAYHEFPADSDSAISETV
jgi:hypothetical protein